MSADNVWFLLGYVSMRTPHGIAAFTPGQQVLTAAVYNGMPERGKLAVTDGLTTMLLDRTLLTHDIDLAVQLAKQDSQSQSAMDAARLAELNRIEANRLAADLANAQDVQRDSWLRMKSNAVGASTRLDEGPTTVRGHAGGRTAVSGYHFLSQPTPAPTYHSPLFSNP